MSFSQWIIFRTGGQTVVLLLHTSTCGDMYVCTNKVKVSHRLTAIGAAGIRDQLYLGHSRCVLHVKITEQFD